MRARRLAVLVSLVLLAAVASPVGAQPQPGGVAADRYIVVFNDDVADPASAAAQLARQHRFDVELIYRHAIRGFAAAIPAGRVAALERDPRVSYVEADQVASISAQSVPTGIARIFAPGNGKIDIDGNDDFRVDVDVAIIDTGIDLDHPDLDVVASTNCSGGGPFRSSCGTGGDDDNGHGTHVAGTVAAIDDAVGVVGVAPGARVHAVKVLGSNGSGYISWIVAGIDWVTARASTIEVANMSLSCECVSTAMNDAIAESVDAGVAYAVAAGNSDIDASSHSPANHPDVLTVSALADFNGAAGGGAAPTCRNDQDDTLADFSNFGSLVEIAAPGVCILSSVPGGGYDTFSGTSMASPHAAGALALLASANNPGNQIAVQGLYDTLEANGNHDWTDDSGDSVKEPLLDVSNTAVFAPTLVAGDGGAAGGGGDTATSHVGDMTGSSSTQGRNAWKATVTISVHDMVHAAVADATVIGQWSDGANASCTTGSNGSCSVTRTRISNSTPNVTFTVSNVTHASLDYDETASHQTSETVVSPS